MSVLINMEKPDHCLRCPVKGINDECLLQSVAANNEYETWEDQMANCPLVPVPKHGRLADLDKIENEIAQLAPEDYTTGAIRLILDYAPTIIPAEEET
jgi:hypothetical protein